MPRVLRSESLRRRTLPWETLAHIYSYCDTRTLAVLSLVSFGSWELASPILYEHVKLTSLEGIKALLFLEDAPLTARLNPAVPLLNRIKALTLHLSSQSLETKTIALDSACTYPGDFAFASLDAGTPHRLRRAGHPITLPLDRLSILAPSIPSDVLAIACIHLLPNLNPRHVIHQIDRDAETRADAWRLLFNPLDVSFLARWRALQQVTWDGALLHVTLDGGQSHTGPLYRSWSPNPEEGTLGANPRTLELKFDFASQLGTYTKTWNAFGLAYRVASLQGLLSYGGASRPFADRVPLKVTLLVKQEDATEAKKDVDALEDWLKKVVVVETA